MSCSIVTTVVSRGIDAISVFTVDRSTGVAAGIILDATVVRALLVPALMRLLGDANWWMPDWAHTVLFVKREKLPEPARESV